MKSLFRLIKDDEWVSKKLYITHDEESSGKTMLNKVKQLVEDGSCRKITHLNIGYWEDAGGTPPKDTVNYLTEHALKFPKLRSIYIGDMTYEECEVSWIVHCDLGPLLKAFPRVTEFKVRGSEGLRFSSLKHKKLKKLEIICGGLARNSLADIAAAELPSLQKLKLYLGIEGYGFNGSLEDIKPFMERDKFPKLTFLGLMNSGISDEIAIEIADSPILEQLKILNLSQGTISDRGAEALLGSEKVKQLKELDLSHHYMTDEMVKKVKALGITVYTAAAQGPDVEENCRYPVVTE